MMKLAPRPPSGLPLRPYSTGGRGRGEGGRKMLEDQLGFKNAAPAAAAPRAAAPSAAAAAPFPTGGRGRGAAPPQGDRRPAPQRAAPASPRAEAPAAGTPPPAPTQAQAVTPAAGGRGRGTLVPPPQPQQSFGRGRSAAPAAAPGEQTEEGTFRAPRPRRAQTGRFSASGRIGAIGSERVEGVQPRERTEDKRLDDPDLSDDLLDSIGRGDSSLKWRAKLQTKIKREAVAELKAEGVQRKPTRPKGRGAAAGAATRSKESGKEEEKPEAPEMEEDLLDMPADVDLDVELDEGTLNTEAAERFMPVDLNAVPSPVPGALSYLMDVAAPAISRTVISAVREDKEEAKQARKSKKDDDEEDKLFDDDDGEKKKKEPPPEFRIGLLQREERAQDMLFRIGGKKELFASLAIDDSRRAKRREHYRKLFEEFLPTATPEAKGERRRAVRAKLRELRAAKKAKKKNAAPAVPAKKGTRLRRVKKREKREGRPKYNALGVMGSLFERLSEETDEYSDQAIGEALTMMDRALVHNPHWPESLRKVAMERTRTEFALLTRKAVENDQSKERLTKWLFQRHWAKHQSRKDYKQAIFRPYTGQRT